MIKKLIVTTLIVVSAFTASTFGCSEFSPGEYLKTQWTEIGAGYNGYYMVSVFAVDHNRQVHEFNFAENDKRKLMQYVNGSVYWERESDMVALYDDMGVCFLSKWD